MTYPTVQFVDAAEVGATVRFDFNDGTATVNAEGYSLGTPSLEGEPDGIGAEWGFRRLAFTMEIDGTKAVALAKQSALARELMRQTNWLLFQLSATSDPVWFKTYRTAPGEISLERVYEDGQALSDVWEISVQIDAEPFAYGERVTLSSVTINNDPAHATNPLSYQLPAIVGDAPAPLALRIYPSATTHGFYMASTCAIPDEGDATPPYVWQAENFGNSTDASDLADANYSGGSKVVVSFATQTGMRTRIAGLFDPISGTGLGYPPPIGRYKILVRVGRSDTTSVFKIKAALEADTASTPDWPDEYAQVDGTSDDTTWATWVDVRDLTMPPSAAAELPAGVGRGYSESVALHIGAERVSGTGSLWIDAVMAVPTELNGERAGTLFIDTHGKSVGSPNNYLFLDGEPETVIVGDTILGNGLTTHVTPPIAHGAYPEVLPGESNQLTLVLHVEGTAVATGVSVLPNDDDITVSSAVVASYQPRWLWLAG